MNDSATLRRIRILIVLFVVGLILSGVTAFPLGIEARALDRILHGAAWPVARHVTFLTSWIDEVSSGLSDTYARHPYIAYGTDWLAFGHLAIAVAFWGPYREPVRNIWVLKFGLISCAGVVPLALICAPLRHIPLWWIAVDSSFGVFGAIPLYAAYRMTRGLELAEQGRERAATAAGRREAEVEPA
ncbi:hypothetical protein KDK95_30325 [Actinospica sp. MGRD01-02]|uniref:Cytoplasmic membrane protein n=1 Tax=Actinospica acidithermotolerans TaxID=2828514 RepID=A0A941IM30_9ACTN|nr:hypothetical protein [Actinospica acidithermotolerans]MBR7830637.1 hypothetical protein [Actinospica acidithermotolerans]